MRHWKTISLSSFVFLISCHSRQASPDFIIFPESQLVGEASCRSAFALELETTHGEKQSVKAQAHFLFKETESELQLYFLSPLGQRIAEMRIGPHRQIWRDSSGRVEPLDEHPLFRDWFLPEWWQELGFMHRLVHPSYQARALIDPLARSWIFHGHRQISCEEDSRQFERECRFTDHKLTGQLDFTFLKCEEPLD